MTKKPVMGVVSLVVTAGALCAAPALTWASIVKINSLLTNSSFEASPLGPGGFSNTCPSGWICGGSPGAGFNYPTSPAQYDTGLGDGLPYPRIVPDGNQAAFAPTAVAGSGSLKQSITGLNYLAGNTYVFTFWVGLPKTLPDGTLTTFGFPGVQVSWTIRGGSDNGVNDNLCGNGTGTGGKVGEAQLSIGDSACILAVTSPGSGQWRQWQISYTPQFSQFGDVGINFAVNTIEHQQPQSANFDIEPTNNVPEPGTLLLLAAGFGSFAFARRRGNKGHR